VRPARRAASTVALVATASLGLALPAGAGAVIHPAGAVDGPANNILEVDGAALASDGTGGIVYRKQVGGVAHVFAVQFAGGRWGAPIEVDAEDPFGASQPAIAAGDGGRLLVVWVQPRNVNTKGVTLSELMSASLQPGASAFGQAVVVDPNVGEPYTGDVGGVEPALAMSSSSGQAYVAYRVLTNGCNQNAGDPANSSCVPNSPDKVLDVRVARFSYLTWGSLGAVNRAPQIAMRNPTRENAPTIGIALNGNGVVAWQEPGSDHVARIWVRRLFGAVQGNVLQASPEALGGRPVTSDADVPALADSPYGEARVAYRIQGAPGSAVPATQLYLNTIAAETAPHGAALAGAAPLPAQGGLGPPSAAIDVKGGFRLAWTQGGAVQELAGNPRATGPPVGIGVATGQALATINPAGGGTTAWTLPPDHLPAVAVREDYARGAFQYAQVAGGIPGQVAGLALGGDEQGDALLGFTQGPPGQSEVVGDFVQAPPAPFVIEAPQGWVRARSALVNWEPAPDAVAGVTYAVYVDGRARVRGLTRLSARVGGAGLGDGVHRVQVLATDAAGQQTMSPEADLKIDANPPIVRLGRFGKGRGVRVTVRDAASGVNAHATIVSFGDGQRASRHSRSSHLYAHAGTYTITARVRDKAGNAAVVHLRVRIA
jgi:hypothetical protein